MEDIEDRFTRVTPSLTDREVVLTEEKKDPCVVPMERVVGNVNLNRYTDSRSVTVYSFPTRSKSNQVLWRDGKGHEKGGRQTDLPLLGSRLNLKGTTSIFVEVIGLRVYQLFFSDGMSEQ